MLVMVSSGALAVLAKEGIGRPSKSIETVKTVMDRIAFKVDRLVQEGGEVAKAS